jgi:hypothetical protein
MNSGRPEAPARRAGAREGAGSVLPGPAGALVVAPPSVQGEYAARVTDGEGADPLAHSPGDEGFGGFVLGLAPPVPGLH